jgi:hypothetical protein
MEILHRLILVAEIIFRKGALLLWVSQQFFQKGGGFSFPRRDVEMKCTYKFMFN